MANFNPSEQNSLVALLAAMNGGMSGSTGYGLLSDILGQQQNRIAARQERTGSLIDMLVNGAAGGQSYEAAKALAGAYTAGPNLPPRIEDALGSLYGGGSPGQPGAPSFGGQNALGSMQPIQPAPDTMSPIFQAQPMSPQDQLALQELQQNEQVAQATAMAAPTVAAALADQAVSLLANGGPDGQPVSLAQVLTDPMIQDLDPATKAMVIQEIQARLDQQQQAAAQQAQAQQAPAPVYNVGGTTGAVRPRAQTYNVGGATGAVRPRAQTYNVGGAPGGAPLYGNR